MPSIVKEITAALSGAVPMMVRPGTRFELARGERQQPLLVRVDVVDADGVDVVDGRRHADRARDVRRAGFELERQFVEGGLLETHGEDHVAAALPRRHGLEQRLAPDERADAGGAVHLVRREGVEVAVERFEVHALVRHGLGAVDEHHGAARVREAGDLAHRQHRAERIRHMRAGDDARAFVHVRGDSGHVDDAAPVHGHGLDDGAGLPGHQLPRHDVGVMFEPGEQDLVAALQARARIGLRHEVDGFGGAAREDDFARRGGIHEFAHAFARAFEHGRGFLAQLVHAAMHVGVVHPLVVVDRRDHALGPLRGSRAVEEYQRLAMHLAREDREVAPHALHVVAAGDIRFRAHGFPNNPSRADTSLSCAAMSVSISARNSAQSTRDTASSMNAHCSSVCAVRRSMPRDNR